MTRSISEQKPIEGKNQNRYNVGQGLTETLETAVVWECQSIEWHRAGEHKDPEASVHKLACKPVILDTFAFIFFSKVI